MKHPKTAAWDRKLTVLLREIDAELEDRFGDRYPLHPARSQRGSGINPSHDGLFRLSPKFSAGYGSRYGPGYIIDLDIMTLRRVTSRDRATFEDAAAKALRAKLQNVFPGQSLSVDRDGGKYKLHGDLDLGNV